MNKALIRKEQDQQNQTRPVTFEVHDLLTVLSVSRAVMTLSSNNDFVVYSFRDYQVSFLLHPVNIAQCGT